VSFTHLDERGNARMVDVSAKAVSFRRAVARCRVLAAPSALAALRTGGEELELLAVARMAGTQAAKRTARLVPLCHPINLAAVRVEIEPVADGYDLAATAEIEERTGVEMEALTACAGAGLTLLCALLARDPAASLEQLALWEKSGGKSGDWMRPADVPLPGASL